MDITFGEGVAKINSAIFTGVLPAECFGQGEPWHRSPVRIPEKEFDEDELSELPEPFNTIAPLPYDKGINWLQTSNAQSLVRLMSMYPIKTVIELGTYLAASTTLMARLLPKDGLIYTVDLATEKEIHH